MPLAFCGGCVGFAGKVHLCLKGCFCKYLLFIQIGKIMPESIRLTAKGLFNIKEEEPLFCHAYINYIC